MISHQHLMHRTLSRPRLGFTIVEAVLAVLIMGILAAVAVPKFARTLESYRVDAAAKRIQYDLKLARQAAISSSSSTTVQFTPAAGKYDILGVTDSNHPHSTYSVDLTVSPYQVVLTSADLGGDTLVIFDLYGRPDSGGTIAVRSGNITQTITVDADTGRATIP